MTGDESTTGGSNRNANTDFSDRHVRVKTAVGEVVVRDDRESLEEMEATAGRLLDRVEDIHEEHVDETGDGGVYR